MKCVSSAAIVAAFLSDNAVGMGPKRDKKGDKKGVKKGKAGKAPTTFTPTTEPTPICVKKDKKGVKKGKAGKAFILDLTTDKYGSETSWEIKDSSGAVQIDGSGYSSYTQYTENWCKNSPGCDIFTIKDSFGDGICCTEGNGSYTLTYDGVVIKRGGDFEISESTPLGCSMPPTPAPTPCTGTPFILDLTTDDFGSDTSWEIKDSSGAVQSEGSGYSSNTQYTENWCKNSPGCDIFTIKDSFGDGICCTQGSGSYTLTYDGVVIKTGGDFDFFESFPLGCSMPPTPTPAPTPEST